MEPFNTVTTLNEIRANNPCLEGWGTLLAHLGKTSADDEPLDIKVILESNGFDDATWCLCAESLERLSRHFQAWCAEQVLPFFETAYPSDSRVRDQIAMLRNDMASQEERDAARAAARAVVLPNISNSPLGFAHVAARVATYDDVWAAAFIAIRITGTRVDQEKQFRLMIGA